MKKLWIPLVLCSVAWAKDKPKEQKYSCVAGANEQCASDLWYADYLKLKAMKEKYQIPQDVADQMNGMAMRLLGQTPQGYKWDEDKQRFVKQAVVVQQDKPAEKKP